MSEAVEQIEIGVDSNFPFPEIPTMLTQPEERKAYLMAHYWDNFNFADTALVNNRNVSEQGAANYLAILADGTLSEAQVKGSLDGFCKGMEVQEHARKVFLQMMEDYLYNPNSPYHNEALYALFLERMLKSEYVDEARKSSLKFSLDLISRNCPGKVATDFVYSCRTAANGRWHRRGQRTTVCCWCSTIRSARAVMKRCRRWWPTGCWQRL